MPGKKTRTRAHARLGRGKAKSQRQRKTQRKTQRRHKRQTQTGGSFIEDSRRIPDDAMYTSYDPDVEGMFTTEVRSNFKKALVDDSMDTLSTQGI